MNDYTTPSEVRAIQNWLNPEFYKIIIEYRSDNIYTISALREQGDHVYELNIEYNCERTTALLTIHCLKEVNPEKYYFCMELLNYLNIHNTEVKFSLNPETMSLSCSQVIGFASWEADTNQLTDRLYSYTCCSLDDLSRIIKILEEDIGIIEAVHRSIGDVFVFF